MHAFAEAEGTRARKHLDGGECSFGVQLRRESLGRICWASAVRSDNRAAEPTISGSGGAATSGYAGSALAGPQEEPVQLAPGDYVAYPGDVTHIFRALEPGTWGVLVSEHV
jgi:hypothetical protein